MRHLFIYCMLLISTQLFAADAKKSKELFDQFFKIEVRGDNGELAVIRKFSRPSTLVMEETVQNFKSNFVLDESSVDELDLSDEDKEIVRQALNEFNTSGLTATNPQEVLKKILAFLKKELKNIDDVVDPRIIAYESDSLFYAKRMLLQKLLQSILTKISEQYAGNPYITIAIRVVVAIFDRLEFEREYYQNVLTYLMMETDPQIYGLSYPQANRIMSSVFESRIALEDVLSRKKARETWDRYGVDTYYEKVRSAQESFDVIKSANRDVLRRNSFFAEDGASSIMHLLYKNSQTKSQSLAYNGTEPGKIYQNRLVLRAAEIGLYLLPLPASIKSRVQTKLRSFYWNQIREEGYLFTELILNDRPDLGKIIFTQSFNLI